MRRRLTASILTVASLAVVLFGLPLLIVVQRFVDEQAALGLERRAVLTSRQVPNDFATNEDPVEVPARDGITYGVYDHRGHLVSGVGPREGDAIVTSALTNKVRQAEMGETRVAAIPIVDQEAVIGVVRASQPTTVADRRAERAAFLLVALAVVVIAIGAVVARLVAGRLVRPVEVLRDRAVRLGDGDFDVDVSPTGIAELDAAGAALATTAERLEDLIRRERAFSADASHQLRTPLAALRTNIEAEIHFPRPSRELVLTEALEDISSLETTIEELLAFARTSTVTTSTVEIGPFVERLRSDWNGPLARLGRPLVATCPDDSLLATGTDSLLRQALDALIGNAATHGSGEVRITVRSTDDAVTVEVSDQGQGFGESASAGATPPISGHGFGLPLARRLVETDGGRLVIANRGPNPVIKVVLSRR